MDSIISLGQKNTLAEYMILSGADNRSPMLDKDLYDSWKSRMELYMQNKEHRRMILESVENGPLIWPTIEENGVTRTKKYAELFAAEKIQADCDMKASNIILQVFIQQSLTSTTVFTISIWINSSQSTLLTNLSITTSIQSFIRFIIISTSFLNESSNLILSKVVSRSLRSVGTREEVPNSPENARTSSKRNTRIYLQNPEFTGVYLRIHYRKFPGLPFNVVFRYDHFFRFDFFGLFRGERGDVTARVILFGTIPTAIPATVPIVDPPVVHDDTPLIPTKTPTIPPVVSTLPHTSPFLYTDSSDSDTSERPPSQDPYEVTVAWWRSRVVARSSPSSPHIHTSSSHSTLAVSFARPPRKRRISLVVLVSLATPVPGALSPACVDILPPHKRIRGSVSTIAQDDSTEESYKAYTEPNIDFDVQTDIDDDTTVVEAAAAREADVGVEVSIRSGGEDEAEEKA
uniref:Integrase, catalytic region, zinc finger, CCHC-type, peptidase aspartic, catalytic n=1 Tax=Tanacetum cinerariifolium TaxID=118510 RepID=A0A6L2JLF9_TANCI|nr:hypothetical protein [Tanacetum cinerariifolium]